MEDTKSTRKKTGRKMAAAVGAGVLCSILAFAGTTILDSKAKTQTHAERASVPYIAASDAREETIRSRADAYKRELARRQEEARAEEEARRKAAIEEKRKAEEAKRQQAEDSQRQRKEQTAQQRQRSPAASAQRVASQPVPQQRTAQPAPQQRVAQQASGVRYSWTSRGSTQADVDRGCMIRQTDNFYAADIKTSAGRQIRSLRKGDIVSINGRKVMIDGEVYDNYNTGCIEKARSMIAAKGYSYSSVCFQTCIPPYGGPIVIKFGHYV